MVGELVIWQGPVKRSATLKGHEAGVIATILVSEMSTFADEHPETAYKLLRANMRSALRKQILNTRAARSVKLGPSVTFSTPTPLPEVHPSAPVTLNKLLTQQDFSEEEVSLLCMEVSYFEVKEGQVLLEAGQPWPYIVFILRGSVSYDAWGYVVDSMATSEDSDVPVQVLRIIGGVALFGDSVLSDTSRIRMSSAGTLAGLSFEQFHDLSSSDSGNYHDMTSLAHRLLFMCGQVGSFHRLRSAFRALHRLLMSSITFSRLLSPPFHFTCGQSAISLTINLMNSQLPPAAKARASKEASIHAGKIWSRGSPMEAYHRSKVGEQQSQEVSSERGADGPISRHAQSQLDNFKLLHRMTSKKLHALQSETEGTQRELTKLSSKLRKSIREERKATQLASKVMGPLEKLHAELSSRVKGADQAKLAELLNSTRSILEKHKCAPRVLRRTTC